MAVGRWKLPDTGRTQAAARARCRLVAERPRRAARRPRADGRGPRGLHRVRWHEALRRRIPEASAESRVRGAQASAALEGANLPVDLVRDLMRGARRWPEQPDPVERVAKRVVQATAETEHVSTLLRTAPLQALARLHVAAATGLVGDEQARPPAPAGEECAEFVDLRPAPGAAEARDRLSGLVEVLAGEGVPGGRGRRCRPRRDRPCPAVRPGERRRGAGHGARRHPRNRTRPDRRRRPRGRARRTGRAGVPRRTRGIRHGRRMRGLPCGWATARTPSSPVRRRGTGSATPSGRGASPDPDRAPRLTRPGASRIGREAP